MKRPVVVVVANRATRKDKLIDYVGEFHLELLDLDIQALDFLVEGGERDAELLGSVGLVPVAALQLVDDDAALDVFEDVEERGVGCARADSWNSCGR
jgi:hypothetical protein